VFARLLVGVKAWLVYIPDMLVDSGKFRSFTDLLTWQEGHLLVLMIYKELDALPRAEKYALVPQLQRAVVSITNNVAEGSGRRSPQDQLRFYYMSLGSVKEVQNQLLICRDLGYLPRDVASGLLGQSAKVSQLLHGLIKATKKRANGLSGTGV
jgi:four helix bundle protein